MVQGNSTNQPKSQIPNLLIKEIQDLYLRQNFTQLVNYFANQNQLLNFSFYELNITAATTSNQTMAHSLGIVPKDLIVCQATGTGSVQFLFGLFTSTSITYTATGPCRVRFFLGTYFGDTSQVQAQKTDTQTVYPNPATSSTATATSIVKTTGNYTMLGTEKLILAKSAGQAQITLPSVATSAGYTFSIQKIDTTVNPIMIYVNSADQAQIVNSGTLYTGLYTPFGTLTFSCDGKNWYVQIGTSRAPNIIRYLSGSGIYTPTIGCLYIKVRMVGGGGGGGAYSSTGGTGGNTTFGASPMLKCTGGGGGGPLGGYGSGGTATVNSPANPLVSVAGGMGGCSCANTSINFYAGGMGAASPFGGAGTSITASGGTSAQVNSGSGGGGAGNTNSSPQYAGSGGGSGGYLEAIVTIPSISSTYAYSVGAPGAGAGGGGNGGSGIIIIEEHFQ